jgi:lipopolysaccharide/colanic/teichoic acid biosynthesis glycosyltransferase
VIELLHPARTHRQASAFLGETRSRAHKRALDIFGALAGLTLCAPLLLALAVLVWLDSGGPVLFHQIRVGRGGRRFRLLKFRTMIPGSEALLQTHIRQSAVQHAWWVKYQKLRNDPRLTRLGAYLRRSSLDELPQLWNVLKGEMSLVGPRPILPDQQAGLGLHYAEYLQVRPGMTGLWQVSGRNRLTFDERACLDSTYVRNWSLWLDLKILARTLPTVLMSDGAG